MRGLRIVHQLFLRLLERLGAGNARGSIEQPADQSFGRIVIVGSRPMAGDHRSRTGANKRTHQTIERNIAPSRDPGLARGTDRG